MFLFTLPWAPWVPRVCCFTKLLKCAIIIWMKKFLLETGAGCLAGLVLMGVVLGLHNLRTKDEYLVLVDKSKYSLVEWAPNNFGPNLESVQNITDTDGAPIQDRNWSYILEQKTYDVHWVSRPSSHYK